jgi:hypothetical protein
MRISNRSGRFAPTQGCNAYRIATCPFAQTVEQKLESRLLVITDAINLIIFKEKMYHRKYVPCVCFSLCHRSVARRKHLNGPHVRDMDASPHVPHM